MSFSELDKFIISRCSGGRAGPLRASKSIPIAVLHSSINSWSGIIIIANPPRRPSVCWISSVFKIVAPAHSRSSFVIHFIVYFNTKMCGFCFFISSLNWLVWVLKLPMFQDNIMVLSVVNITSWCFRYYPRYWSRSPCLVFCHLFVCF